MKLEWYLDGNKVGESETHMVTSKEVMHPPYSITRVCQTCGKAWSHVKVIHPDTVWLAEIRLCPEHGGHGIMGEWEEDIYPLPDELSLSEFKGMRALGGELAYRAFILTGGK